jgi:flagellum-specific ATP synthase
MSSDLGLDLNRLANGLEYVSLFRESGRVKKVLGPIVEGILPGAVVGGLCEILSPHSSHPIEAEIVGFRDRVALLMPMSPVDGISMGARIEQTRGVAQVRCADSLLGALLNGYGRRVDGQEVSGPFQDRPIKAPALLPGERRSIEHRLKTGVRALDLCIPFGLGQRLAVMAASGVGKSVLMGMLARSSQADVNIIALIGERGREVTEFLERDLGPEGMKRSIVIAVTSDESPVLKVRGAYVATTLAEYFRDQGKNVLLMMDSVTRFGMALREIGLAAGEPPTTKGYTPSVFAQMPKLLERAGAKRKGGSITGLYTVLVEGNDFDDPVADHVRSVVDGHVVLSRELAARNHYPAVDVLSSVSRLTGSILNDREQNLNSKLRQILATYKGAEDLINIGGYRKGNNAEWDYAIERYPKLITLLKQGTREGSELEEVLATAEGLVRG